MDWSIKVTYLVLASIASALIYLYTMDKQTLINSNSIQETKETTQTILTEEEIESIVPAKKGFMKRAFGPILPGAMRGAIFTLLAGATGPGMFNLPYRVHTIGIVAYIIFVVIGGLFSYLGMQFMSRLIVKFKVESYSAMSQMAYGKYFRKFSQFCLIFYSWGLPVCFQVIFAKFIVQLLADNFGLPLYNGDIGRQNQDYSEAGQWVRILITIGAIVVDLFFTLKKQAGILQKISVVGVISFTINVIIITFTLFLGFTVQVQDKDRGITVEYVYHGITSISWDRLSWFRFDNLQDFSQQTQGLASLIFCYVNHQLVFPLVSHLKNPNKRRLDKVFRRSHITEAISYILVGMAGYLLLAEHSAERPINAIVLASIQTIAMSVGKLLMVFSLFFAVPLNLVPTKQVIYASFGMQKTNKNNIILSLSLAFSGALIAILFQKVNSYFGLLGGTTGVLMAGLIPCICYNKLHGLRNWKQKLMMVFMGLVSLLCMIGAFLSVIAPE